MKSDLIDFMVITFGKLGFRNVNWRVRIRGCVRWSTRFRNRFGFAVLQVLPVSSVDPKSMVEPAKSAMMKSDLIDFMVITFGKFGFEKACELACSN